MDDAEGLSAYDSGLPRKRVAAGVLFFDTRGRVLLVDPIYKDPWEIPGGAVEENESPRDGAAREVKEELGLLRPPGRLLAVDWAPPRPGRSEGITFVYDGGNLTPGDAAKIVLAPDELRGWAFVPVAQLGERLVPVLARRVLGLSVRLVTPAANDGVPAGGALRGWRVLLPGVITLARLVARVLEDAPEHLSPAGCVYR